MSEWVENLELIKPGENKTFKNTHPLDIQARKNRIDDIKMQEYLDENFNWYKGLENFRNIIYTFSPDKKDFLYIFIKNWKFKDYVDIMLWWQMPPDKESIEAFLSENTDNIWNDILNISLEWKSEQELKDLKNRNEDLLKTWNLDITQKNKLLENNIKISQYLIKIRESRELALNLDFQKSQKENLEIKNGNISTIGNFFAFLKHENFWENGKINSFIKEFNSLVKDVDVDKIEILIKKLLTFLNQEENLKTILKESSLKSKEAYKKVYNFVESLARQSPNSFESQEILVKLHQFEAENPFDKEALPNKSTIYEAQAKEFFGSSEAKKDGEIYKNGDKMMDFSAVPPKAYVVWADGEYKLETDLPQLPNTENILSKRRELQKIRFELKQIWELEKEFQDLSLKENKTENEKKRFKELEGIVERNKDKIKELIKIAEELRKALLNIDFDSKEKQRLSEKQQKQEKTLSFLHSTWFDIIPQTFTDKVIEEVNFAKKGIIDLWWEKRLQENINIKEGKFWNSVLENEEEIFIRFFNKMVSGNPTEPLSIESYKSKEKNPEQFTRLQLLENFRNWGILDINGDYKFQKMMDNLLKPLWKSWK